MIIYTYRLQAQYGGHITVLKAWDQYNHSFWAPCTQSHRSAHMQAQAMPCLKCSANLTQQLVIYLHVIQVFLQLTYFTFNTLTIAE